MNNEELEKVWKLRMNLRNKAKDLNIKGIIKEKESLNFEHESDDIKFKQELTTFLVEPSIEKLIKTYGNNINEKLKFHEYCNICTNTSINLRNECIKIPKECRDIKAESDDIWIKAVLKIYGNIEIKWIYDEEKNDFICELENGEIYS